jgi:hypothetical protein
MGKSNKENSDNTHESSIGGETSADYIIRGSGEDRIGTTEGGGGITDKIKEKVKGAKDKVLSTADAAADTAKKGISSTTATTTNEQGREYEEGEAGTRFDRTKDSTQEYDEKEPMSPAKIKQHEPTAVRSDFTDQKIIESGHESHDETLDRGDVVQQEHERIIEQAERPIKEKQTERRDPKDRGEAVEQEQERIFEEKLER